MAPHSLDFFTMMPPYAIHNDDPPLTECVVPPPKKLLLRTLKNLKGKTAHAIFPFLIARVPLQLSLGGAAF